MFHGKLKVRSIINCENKELENKLVFKVQVCLFVCLQFSQAPVSELLSHDLDYEL